MKTRIPRLLFVCLFLVSFLLSGCRVRLIGDANDADQLLVSTSPVQTDTDAPPESTEPPETDAPSEPTEPTVPTEPDPTDETEQTEEPTEPSEPERTPDQPPDQTKESSPGQPVPKQPDTPAPEPSGPSDPGTVRPVEQPTEPFPAPGGDEPDTLTVTYDPNGGEGPRLSASVEPGTPYGAMPEASFRGHIFNGWWTDPEGGERVFPETVVAAAEDHTLWAHWLDAGSFTVRFDPNGGTIKDKEKKIELRTGEVFGTLPTPRRSGYRFAGWWTDPETGTEITEDSVFAGESDMTLWAHWTYDPFAWWTYVLQNKTQQIYLCQQMGVYFETVEEHRTQRTVPLISDTGSFNIAESRQEEETDDDWVRAKNPDAIVKCVSSMAEADAARAAMAQRFPGKPCYVVTSEALGSGSAGLYARLYLAKELYGDWYTDVDLDVVRAELGVTEVPIR